MIKHYSGYGFLLAILCWQACAPSHSASSGNVTTPTAEHRSAAAGKDPLQQWTEEDLLQQPGLQSAQIGICLYDPTTAAYKYDYQSDKYFIPASNTKLFSLYAGLK